MKELEAKDSLGDVERGVLGRHLALAQRQRHQVAAGVQLEGKVQAGLGLEGSVHVRHEGRRRDKRKHRPLHPDVLEVALLILKEECLLDRLERNVLLRCLVLGQENLAVGATAEHLEQLVLVDGLLGRLRHCRRGGLGAHGGLVRRRQLRQLRGRQVLEVVAQALVAIEEQVPAINGLVDDVTERERHRPHKIVAREEVPVPERDQHGVRLEVHRRWEAPGKDLVPTRRQVLLDHLGLVLERGLAARDARRQDDLDVRVRRPNQVHRKQVARLLDRHGEEPRARSALVEGELHVQAAALLLLAGTGAAQAQRDRWLLLRSLWHRRLDDFCDEEHEVQELAEAECARVVVIDQREIVEKLVLGERDLEALHGRLEFAKIDVQRVICVCDNKVLLELADLLHDVLNERAPMSLLEILLVLLGNLRCRLQEVRISVRHRKH
eukprot:m.232774 g.232774  ORF g.232774 m.232774 type:complete len:438 (+) comp12410_c0_seq1:771-2084(+)